MRTTFSSRLLLLLVLACSPTVFAQNIFTEGIRGSLPTIRFSFENQELTPATYEVWVDATGDAEYFSRDESSPDDAAVRRRFQVSKKTRDRIFELTRALKKFRGDYEFRKHRVAFSGLKTFTYTEGAEEYSTRFNWSENKDATELAALFQGIATTVQAEADLLRLRKFDKLGLDARLKQMEGQAKSGWLREIGIIAKVLNEIKADPAVMGMARARAQRILKFADN